MADKDKKEKKDKKVKRLVVEETVSSENEDKEEDKEKRAVDSKDEKDIKEEKPEEDREEKEEKSKPEDKKDKDKSKKDNVKKDEKEKKSFAKNFFLIFLPIFLIVAALVGGIVFYSMNAKNSQDISEKSTPEPTMSSGESSPSPSPSPSPTPERSDLKAQVLNGSGIAGMAGEVADFLEGLGYENVDTSNAETYDYEETVVSIKEESEEYLDLIIDDLSEEYSVSPKTQTLDEDSEYDVVITVGSS
jgi:hypothetical protein